MDQLQVLRLPSMAKFNAGFLQCNQSFEEDCVGPSKKNYEQRMAKVRSQIFCCLHFFIICIYLSWGLHMKIMGLQSYLKLQWTRRIFIEFYSNPSLNFFE